MRKALIPAALMLALAACGGDDAGPAATTAGSSTTPATTSAPTTTAAPTTTVPARRTFGQIVTDCGAKLWDARNTGYILGRANFLALADSTDTITMLLHDADGISGDAFGCVLDEVAMPEFDRARIDSTRALDGMVTAEWDGYRAAWTYHPDDGLRITIEDTTLAA